MKTLCTIDGFSEEAKEILAASGEVVYSVPAQDEFADAVTDVDALLVRLGLNIDQAVIDSAPHLKVIATATTGLNHIDTAYAAEKAVKVLSLKDEVEFLDTITSTAELAFSLMLDLMRLNPWAFDAIKYYNLDLEGYRGHSLYGKTLGVVGMGRLGKILAAGAAGWRMNVIFSDPYVSQEKFPQYKKVELDELMTVSDVVSLHVHLSDETANMINTEVLRIGKSGAFLVNTARGELVDEDAVLAALESGRLGGYATDVLRGEQDLLRHFSNHPLVEYAKKNQNCIIVPHTGGLTHDSRFGTDMFIANKLVAFLSNVC